MWQVLLAAAAAAGSGILAKKLINPTERTSDFTPNPQCSDQPQDFQIFIKHSPTEDSVFPSSNAAPENAGSVFRFSSHETESKCSKKKIWSGVKKNGGGKMGKKCGSAEVSERGWVIGQRKSWNGKRSSVCAKKRRTGKNSSGKCESCASKDSTFGWGVGVGIMYMLSSGKVEISRLNSAMDETTKVVQELKTEISRRKASHNVSSSQNEAETNKMHLDGSCGKPGFTKSRTQSMDNIETFVLEREGNGASTGLTEDQQPEVLEMDQLEAELESELQKLPWCATEGSGSEARTDIFYTESLGGEHQQADYRNSNPSQFNGVSPSELDKKLSQLLIKQQQSEIVELENELHSTYSKLQQKEAELQALKDCVNRLTAFKLASASDDETKGEVDTEKTIYEERETGLESRRTIIGMKRTMEHESYNCCAK